MAAVRGLFGLAEDQWPKVGRTVQHNRLLLAARYIRGSGIEIGGLGRPLKVPSGVSVKYVDRFSVEELKANYPDMPPHKVLAPDIVANGETLDPVGDGSQDFVIANHVIEHYQNPILFFRNAYRVLKPGGVLFLAIPDKEKTFDRDRPVTPFEHLREDYEDGPEGSKRGHFEEFVALADLPGIGRQAWTTESERDALVEKLIAEDYSIHFHVWDIEAMHEMVQRIRTDHGISFRPLHTLASGDEVVFILEKRAAD